MARASLAVIACMTVALLFSWASANTLWMPVQVVDCDNRPVYGATVALWGCVDSSGGKSAVASSPQLSSSVSKTGLDGYVMAPPTGVPSGGCAGLQAQYCFGNAEHTCKITVMDDENTINTKYNTVDLFQNYALGLKDYAVNYTPTLSCQAGLDATPGCYPVTTTLRPSCCPRKCACE